VVEGGQTVGLEGGSVVVEVGQRIEGGVVVGYVDGAAGRVGVG